MLIAIRFSILIFILCGLIYPLGITALGQFAFPWQANGSLLYNPKGKPLGSGLIGQAFSAPQYFHPRPSANQYDAANSGGSNLGATSKTLVERIINDGRQYQQDNAFGQAIALDAITTSGSGLDPDISLQNAMAQLPRVAKARGLSPKALRNVILRHSQRQCSLLEKLSKTCNRVNVLELNLALNHSSARHSPGI